MDKIAQRMKVYIDTNPFDPGDSDCETVLGQLYQVYAESHESDPAEISEGFKELEEFLCNLPWKITMLSSTSAAACAAHTSEKRLSMVCNTGHIYRMK